VGSSCNLVQTPGASLKRTTGIRNGVHAMRTATRVIALSLLVLSITIQSYCQLRPDRCSNIDDFVVPTELEPGSPPSSGKDAIVADFATPADVAAQINKFGFDFFQQILEGSDGNAVFSPLSIAAAFSLLHIGAQGETKAEISNTLHYVSDCYPFFLQDIIAGYDEQSVAEELSLATRLYVAEALDINDDFIDTVGEENVVESSFEDTNEAERLINEWVSEQTQGLIDKILPSGSLSPDTLMALVNALFFKGQWQLQFDPDKTFSREFNSTNGAVETLFMVRSGETLLDRQNLIIELPYKNGRFSMIIAMSNGALGVSELAAFGRVFLNEANVQLENTEIHIPKFTFEREYSLHEIMPELNTELVFTNAADLSIISEQGLQVDTGVHKARIEVNEEGTVAAAADALVIVPLQESRPFVVDQPFMFFIRDNQNGLFLFMGSVSGSGAFTTS